MTKTLRTAILCCLGLLLPLASGCSVIGYFIGAAIDEASSGGEEVDVRSIGRVEEGKILNLSLRDGSEVSGTFQGLKKVPQRVYKEEYEENFKKTKHGSVMPSIGDMVHAVERDDTATAGRFVGFGIEASNGKKNSSFAPAGSLEEFKDCYIALATNGPGSETKVYLPDVMRIVGRDEKVIEGITVRKMLKRNEVPLLSYATLATEEGTVAIGLDNIYQATMFEIKSGYDAKTWCSTIGIVVDLLAVTAGTIALIYIFKDFDIEFTPCMQKCYNL